MSYEQGEHQSPLDENPTPGVNPPPMAGDGSPAAPGSGPGHFDVVMRIPVSVQVILGSVTMPVSSLVKLGQGAVISLDRSVGEPVDVVINGRVVARGQVVTTNENNSRFGVSLTEMVGIMDPVPQS